MDRIKVAKELLMVAKALVAYTPKVGDIGSLSYPISKGAEWATPQWVRLLRKTWDSGSGWVEVIKVDGDRITVIPRSYGNLFTLSLVECKSHSRLLISQFPSMKTPRLWPRLLVLMNLLLILSYLKMSIQSSMQTELGWVSSKR